MATHASQKRYPPELRERAVKMARNAIAEEAGQRFGVVHGVARRLGVVVDLPRGWLAKAEIDTSSRPGTSSTDAQRINELEREVCDLRRANDILKAASILHDRARRSTEEVVAFIDAHRMHNSGGVGGVSSRSAQCWRSPLPRTGPRSHLSLRHVGSTARRARPQRRTRTGQALRPPLQGHKAMTSRKACRAVSGHSRSARSWPRAPAPNADCARLSVPLLTSLRAAAELRPRRR